MKFNNMADLRDTLERMDTQQLDAMLLEELRKESPNGDLIRLIGRVLKERDRGVIYEIDANIQQAWEQYQAKAQPVHKRPKTMNSFLLKVASLVLVLFAVAAMLPQEAKAMNFFERFIAWIEDVFSLISPAEAGEREETYVFRTDNPGLQEVYDQVVELGVTDPVVPMWLPEGYELIELKQEKLQTKNTIFAIFGNNICEIVYQLDSYSESSSYEYYKDTSECISIERNGVTYNVMRNKNLWIAVWTKNNIECTIAIDCKEDEFYHVLESIYTMEE